MVLLISSCSQFLMLKVALTMTLMAEIRTMPGGVILHLKFIKTQSYRLFYCFSVKKKE